MFEGLFAMLMDAGRGERDDLRSNVGNGRLARVSSPINSSRVTVLDDDDLDQLLNIVCDGINWTGLNEVIKKKNSE